MESRDENLEPDRSHEEEAEAQPAPASPADKDDTPHKPATTATSTPGPITDQGEELEALRMEIKKNRREITIVKTMLYLSFIVVLVVMYYAINKTQVLKLQDLGTQLTLSQNQASLNLGVQQKTTEERIHALEAALQQVMEKVMTPQNTTPAVDHPGKLNRLEETVTGINGSLSLLEPNSPMLRVKVDLVKENAAAMVESYKQVLVEPKP
ncbi:hypothetical protein [Nitrospina watsonii]|uniref:Uncharacterized protein n=1 Tax=Nitrospina watsonii TaxID=1323948 RepID=A0ABM9HCM9_9BACT|nr:hypothetical protein [Nitrospina watsonii]CAI2717809.1 conserved protein of unknown function [Nitrospina watsonii]